MPIERGEVYWVAFDPSLGEEIQKTRPAIVLSNNAANLALKRVQVVPITSKTHRAYPGETLIEPKGEKAQSHCVPVSNGQQVALRLQAREF